LEQVPKQWWSVPVACLVLPSVCCHCGVVVGIKYILYKFLNPRLSFTWTTLIAFRNIEFSDSIHRPGIKKQTTGNTTFRRLAPITSDWG
jgi:hypothetical protein